MFAAIGDAAVSLVLVIVLAGFVLILVEEVAVYGRAKWHDHEARVRHQRLMREISRHQDDR